VLTWREPHGVTGHIIPWNYPMQIFGRSVGGALAAGNVCVVKPAEDACLSLIRVAQLAAEVGFPPGAINIVTGYGHEVGDALARHPGIDHISFTGSPKVGTLIQQVAAERHCPVTLELGGKSPQIVFRRRRPGRRRAHGHQRHRAERRPDLLGRLARADRAGHLRAAAGAPGQAFEALRVGPAAMDLDVGPLIRQSQQQRVWDFLSDAQHANIPMVAQGRWWTKRPNRLLPGPGAAARRAGAPIAWRRKKCSARCCGHGLQATRTTPWSWPTPPASAWWPASGRATAPASSAWPGASKRPGVHQQLRRRWRRGAALWRRQVVRLRARKGL
jgi:hypothetical protein